MKKKTRAKKVSAPMVIKPASIEFLRHSIPLVYEQILDYTDIPSLNQCRIVSKAWKEIAEKILKRKLELVCTPALLRLRSVFKNVKDSAERILVKRPISFEALPLPQPIQEWQTTVTILTIDVRNHLLQGIVCANLGYLRAGDPSFFYEEGGEGFLFFTDFLQGFGLDDANTILEAQEYAVTAQKMELEMIEKADTRVSFFKLMIDPC